MMRRISSGWMVLGLLAVVVLVGCGGSGEDAASAARQAKLESLRQAKAELDAKRAEQSALDEQLAQIGSSEGEEGGAEAAAPEEGAAAQPAAEELEARIRQLENEIIQAADDFGSEIVGFINANPPVRGEPLTEVQSEALRMKSAEDIVLAQGYIDEGGDYGRAIRIFEDALLADPDNPDLRAALERAQELRYMSQERFATVTKGMSRDEVRDALGQVNLRNIREYPERDVIAWFYPTAEGGAAAGVFFRKDRSGEYVVYQTNYEAVKTRGDAEAPAE